MSIDLTIDFEELLEKAKRRFEVYKKDLRELDKKVSKRKIVDGRNIALELHMDYSKWIKENIQDKGLSLDTELFSGEPVAIVGVLAGKPETLKRGEA